MSKSQANQFGHASYMKLLHEAAAMLFNRLDAEPKLMGHYFIGVTGNDMTHHIAFTIGESLHEISGLGTSPPRIPLGGAGR